MLQSPLLIEQDGRIVWLGSERDLTGEQSRMMLDALRRGATSIDFGDALLMPGFINAHCHLEYSFLKGKLEPLGPGPRHSRGFTEWLAEMARNRREAPDETVLQGLVEGIGESARHGCTCVFDIVSRDLSPPLLRESGLRAWCFLESLALDPAGADAALEELRERYRTLLPLTEPTRGAESRVHLGFSPHTPYTVSEPLLKRIPELAAELNVPATIHVAETLEEAEFLSQGRGPLRELFQRIGFLPAGWRAPGLSPIDYSMTAGALSTRTLVAHANYASDEDIATLSRSGASVVFCPNSHRFFDHDRHPLEEMMQAGVNVCIGTDSLASNHSLDLLSELRTAREMFPEMSALKLFAMIGRNPARWVGGEARIGRLKDTGDCDATVLSPCPPLDAGMEVALTMLLESGSPVKSVATIVGGDLVWREE